MQSLNFDYYYGAEAEQFTFYRIPKVLMTAPHFKRLSSDAKILYGLMLDRMGLSMKNGWVDEANRVYIFVNGVVGIITNYKRLEPKPSLN